MKPNRLNQINDRLIKNSDNVIDNIIPKKIIFLFGS